MTGMSKYNLLLYFELHNLEVSTADYMKGI